MSRYHHGRQDVPDDAEADRASHAATDAPREMIERLLARIGALAYRAKRVDRWMQDQRPLMEALTWPAVWLNNRGVGMPVAEYEAKLGEILDIIARHGDLEAVRFFPAYLGDCIRKHFAHHGDEIYAARKHVRNAVDLGFLRGAPARPQPVDAVATLVQVHAVLAAGKRGAKIRKSDDSQGSLF